jgi:hypothetical protein
MKKAKEIKRKRSFEEKKGYRKEREKRTKRIIY